MNVETVRGVTIAMPNQLADIMVYSPDGQAQLAVEVKGVKGAGDDWANEFRRNLLSENLIPRTTYFLMVLREYLYLWLPNSPFDQEGPNYKAKTTDVLGRLAELEELKTISGRGLEFLVNSWLNAVTESIVTREDAPELEWMLDSGLYDCIRDGSAKLEHQV